MNNKTKGRRAGTRTAFKTAHQQSHHNARPLDKQGGKLAAMFLFNIGAASLEATQAKFSRYPRWRSA